MKHEEGRGKPQHEVGRREGWRDACVRVGSRVLVGCRAPGARQCVGERAGWGADGQR